MCRYLEVVLPPPVKNKKSEADASEKEAWFRYEQEEQKCTFLPLWQMNNHGWRLCTVHQHLPSLQFKQLQLGAQRFANDLQDCIKIREKHYPEKLVIGWLLFTSFGVHYDSRDRLFK